MRFALVFEGDHVGSSMGSAWVGVNPQEHRGKPVITHDCGSPAELERAIGDLKAELDDILRKARSKFAANMQNKAAPHA
jgi:hypothetical protein